MGFFKRIFCRKKQAVSTDSRNVFSTPGLQFFINFEGTVFGPFSLSEIKEYPLLENTLVTTNTLNGEWYEAKYFECFDEMFNPNLGFRIAEDGTIIRLSNKR